MAVVTAGNETIVRYSRGLIAVYYVLVAASSVISLLSLVVAAGMAVDKSSWKDKAWGIGGCIFGSLSFASGAFQVYTMGRAYAQTWVAIGPEGARMQLPRSDGDVLAIGRERQFKWEEIGDIAYESNLRKRACTFRAGDYVFTLNQNNCPSPRTVAMLLAEKKGVALMPPQAHV
jgi:hypothetical protein